MNNPKFVSVMQTHRELSYQSHLRCGSYSAPCKEMAGRRLGSRTGRAGNGEELSRLAFSVLVNTVSDRAGTRPLTMVRECFHLVSLLSSRSRLMPEKRFLQQNWLLSPASCRRQRPLSARGSLALSPDTGPHKSPQASEPSRTRALDTPSGCGHWLQRLCSLWLLGLEKNSAPTQSGLMDTLLIIVSSGVLLW